MIIVSIKKFQFCTDLLINTYKIQQQLFNLPSPSSKLSNSGHSGPKSN